MNFVPAAGQASAIDYSKWELIDSDSDSGIRSARSTNDRPGRDPPLKNKAQCLAEVLDILKDDRFSEQLKVSTARGNLLSAEKTELDRKLTLNPGDSIVSSGEALKQEHSRVCANCRKCEDGLTKLKVCEGCKMHGAPILAMYCGRACQRAAWPTHKASCRKHAIQPPENDGSWMDSWRNTKDGSRHFGKLELMTWEGNEEGSMYGFGGVHVEDAARMRKRFMNKFNGQVDRFCKKHLDAFRWTCCGVTVGKGVHGCDHHGDPRAFHRCGCDFCLAGKVTDSIYREKIKSQAARGLEATLRRGPDPRSLCPEGLRNWELRMAYFGGVDPFC